MDCGSVNVSEYAGEDGGVDEFPGCADPIIGV